MKYIAQVEVDSVYEFEAQKVGLRQGDEGVKVTLNIKAFDIPPMLLMDAMKQRYMVKMVPIGDDEKPRGEVTQNTATAPNHGVHAVADQAKSSDKPRTLTQQIGALCASQAFANWARRTYNAGPDIAEFVRKTCGVTSRREIVPGTTAAAKWKQLFDQFWLDQRGYNV